MSDLRPERDIRRRSREQENAEAEDRDYSNWVKAIGSEGMSSEQVEEYLEEYGWNQMDE
jgi:hypothetical protein